MSISQSPDASAPANEPRIIVFIDEFDELMAEPSKEDAETTATRNSIAQVVAEISRNGRVAARVCI